MRAARDTDDTPAAPGRSLALLVAGNLLLGLALGLIVQYGLTAVWNRLEQRALDSRLREVSLKASRIDEEAMPKAVDNVVAMRTWASEDGAYWKALAEGGPFGRLVISRMGLDSVVVKGAGTADLKRGPGWIPGTDLPGDTGNVGIAGHRTTYGSPFGRIDELVKGDVIYLYSPYRAYAYEVTGFEIVTPDQVRVIASTPLPTLTLTACHPRFSARYRYVVHAKLTRVVRLAPQRPQG